MPRCLIHRLDRHARLSSEARDDLVRMASRSRRTVPARGDLVSEGTRPGAPTIVIDGWAYRYRLLPDGRRSINDVLLPGDLVDARPTLPGRPRYAIAAFTALEVAELRDGELADLAERHPDLAAGLSALEAVDAGIRDERIVSLGQRNASERLGHFMCETARRLRHAGLKVDDGFHIPMTQGDMADALGLTNVHVNRILKALRSSGYVVLKGRRLFFPDAAGLERLSMFDDAYLGEGATEGTREGVVPFRRAERRFSALA
jgi:CRP-like cAMP-binding protein